MSINTQFNSSESLVLVNREYSSDVSLAISENWVKIFLDNDLSKNNSEYFKNVDENVDFKIQIINYIKGKNNIYLNPYKELNCSYNENSFLNKNLKYSTSLFLKQFDVPDYFIIFKSDSWETYNNTEIKNSEVVFSYNFNNEIFKNLIFKYYNNLPQELICETSLDDFYEFKSLEIKSGLLTSFFKIDPALNISNLANHQIKYYKDQETLIPNILNMEFYFNGDSSPDKYYGVYFKLNELINLDLDWTDISARLDIPILNNFKQNEYFNKPYIETNSRYIKATQNIHITDDEFLFLEDKNNFKYQLIPDNDKYWFVNQYFNFNDFLGEVKNSEINLKSISLENNQNSNIAFKLEGSSKNNNIFTEGDYFYVRSGTVPNTEYRVIGTQNIYNYNHKEKYCNPKQNIRFDINSFTDENNDTIKIILNSDFNFKLSNNENIEFYYNNQKFDLLIYDIKIKKIDLINYLTFKITNSQVYQIFTDSEFNIDNVEFHYTVPEYYYCYFNLKSDPEQILNSISEAFNTLEPNYFRTWSEKNVLIVESAFSSNDFEPIYFGYNLSRKTDTSNHFINNNVITNVTLNNYQINKFETKLYGSSNTDNGVIVFLSDLENVNFNDRHFIVTKKYFGSFINKYINKFYSNFIFNGTNLDAYKVITIENKNDIIETTNNLIRIKELFYPKFLKISKF